MHDFKVIHSECKAALKQLIADGIQVDSIVTDPPYEFGFMGKAWDKSGIANDIGLWKLCLEVLKPGGHLLSFGGSRTYHRMACAIEDAGFEIRDQIMWIYGQGFPKSLNISKAIDKMMGAEREVKGLGRYASRKPNGSAGINSVGLNQTPGYLETIPATDVAKQWDGWGSALKPAHEPIVMTRKPLSEKNIASNVIKHGTGGINIDGCRVAIPLGDNKFDDPVRYGGVKGRIYGSSKRDGNQIYEMPSQLGRFPANLIHDGSEEVEAEFAKYGVRPSGYVKAGTLITHNSIVAFGKFNETLSGEFKSSSGSASRFFYSAKASKAERNGSKHPTVKPIALMRYLCRLITPPNGIVLDPFAGTGTTGQAALEEGFGAILIEREDEYIADIHKRMEKIQLPLDMAIKVMEAIA